MFGHKRRQTQRRQSRILAVITLLMLLMSLSPGGMSAMVAQNAGTGAPERAVAQETGEAPASFIEVHVDECPPGTIGEGDALYDACHGQGGEAGVNLQVTATDPAVGVDLPKTTELAPQGYGVINTGDIPAGEYRISVDLPVETNTLSFHCEYRDNDTVVPSSQVDPSTFSVTLPENVDIVCDVYADPQASQADEAAAANLDITVYACDRDDLGSDGRSWDDLSGACTGAPADPVTLTLMNAAGTPFETDIEQNTGEATFADLDPGTYTLYSDVDPDLAGEYLFCTIDGGERYQKEFNADGVTTLTNVEDEQLACEWFIVQSPQEEATATTIASTATVAPPTATTIPPTAVPTEGLNNAPQQVAPDAEPANITLNLTSCPQGYDVAASGEDGATFAANCAEPVADVLMTVTNSAGDDLQVTSNAEGVVALTGLAPDTYTLYSGIPLEAATEYLYCIANGGVEYQKEFNDTGVTTFADVESGQIECSWYVVPEDLRGEETGATVTVHLAACPEGYEGNQFFADCHENGVADLDYTLTGPNGEMSALTTIPATPGPGVAAFTELPAGDYTLAGGPPQDFGSVSLYCIDPSTNEQIDASMEGGIANFTVAGQQSVLCDWYFIPESGQGNVTPTPAPTEVPIQRAEVLVTMFACGDDVTTAGATFGQLDDACTAPLNDITMSLAASGGTPISAATGASGEGAVRFYELRPGDYLMTPELPADYTSAAVYCQIGDGDVYQKTLQNGTTTFVDLEGEQLSCSWFVVPVNAAPAAPAGPTGSITVREFLCEDDRSSITDWEQECAPGSTGTSFSLASSDGAVTRNAAPDAQGVLVFGELPDGYYDLTQDEGVWCRAAAERVDSRSRVIVRDGGNTDVFLYECGQVTNLPDTGSGTPALGEPASVISTVLLAGLAIPAFAAALWQLQRTRTEPVRVPVRASRPSNSSVTTRNGATRMRFR